MSAGETIGKTRSQPMFQAIIVHPIQAGSTPHLSSAPPRIASAMNSSTTMTTTNAAIEPCWAQECRLGHQRENGGHDERGGSHSPQDRCTGLVQDDLQQRDGQSGRDIRRHKQAPLPDEIGRRLVYVQAVEVCGEQKNAAQMQDEADDEQSAARCARHDRRHDGTSRPECEGFGRLFPTFRNRVHNATDLEVRRTSSSFPIKVLSGNRYGLESGEA
jgi:hypothetical protein